MKVIFVFIISRLMIRCINSVESWAVSDNFLRKYLRRTAELGMEPVLKVIEILFVRTWEYVIFK